MGRLAQAGFELVTSADVFPPAMASKGREFRAMVEYFVGMGASRWAWGWGLGEGHREVLMRVWLGQGGSGAAGQGPDAKGGELGVADVACACTTALSRS